MTKDAPFTKMHFISCRNLLIYFQPQAQRTVLSLFHFGARTGGTLFLGASESPGALADEFDTIDEHSKIYRKRRDVALLRSEAPAAARRDGSGAPGAAESARASAGRSVAARGLYDQLLERFMPPRFLVDENGQLVDTFGGAEKLLQVKAAAAVAERARAARRRAPHRRLGRLHAVRRESRSGALRRVPRSRRHSGSCTVVAEPIRDPRANGRRHVLVSLVPREAGGPIPASAEVGRADRRGRIGAGRRRRAVSRDQHARARDRAAYTRETLQATIEELETANEEMQATNEELVASNEELQSTNEELHSVNEELYTVNAEYQQKIAELKELNADMAHLLEGTDVGTVFLDHELRIRRFTTRIASMFRSPARHRPPIRDFSHNIERTTLMDDIERVLRDGVTIEAQRRDGAARRYFLRILPYRAARDGKDRPTRSRVAAIDGVVLTLTDISALEQARARLAQLSAIVESSDDAIVGQTLDGTSRRWNAARERLYGYSADEAIGRHASFLRPSGPKDEIEAVLAKCAKAARSSAWTRRASGRTAAASTSSVTFSPILERSPSHRRRSRRSRATSRQLVGARQELAEREEHIRLLLDSTAEAIYGVDLNGVCIFCNAACARLLGYDSPAALIGKQMHPLIHHTRADGTRIPAEQSSIFAAMRHREEAHVDDEVLVAGGWHVVPGRVLEPSRSSATASSSAPSSRSSTSPSGSRPKRRCRKASAGASSSWRCCRTSCAIRSPRS